MENKYRFRGGLIFLSIGLVVMAAHFLLSKSTGYQPAMFIDFPFWLFGPGWYLISWFSGTGFDMSSPGSDLPFFIFIAFAIQILYTWAIGYGIGAVFENVSPKARKFWPLMILVFFLGLYCTRYIPKASDHVFVVDTEKRCPHDMHTIPDLVRNQCLLNLALETKKYTVCDKIITSPFAKGSDNDLRWACYAAVASSTKNKYICERIPTSQMNWRDVCLRGEGVQE